MTIGTVGIIAELYNPGAILPGIVGAISLILAFYSFQSLPVNYAGVLLFLLGIVFFILEATVTSYGLLAIGGIISMLLGSVMLIKTDVEFLQISWGDSAGRRTRRRLFALNGRNGSEGDAAAAGDRPRGNGRSGGDRQNSAELPQGQLAVRGELWEAISDQPLQPGDRSRSHASGWFTFACETRAQERGLIWVLSRVRLRSCFS